MTAIESARPGKEDGTSTQQETESATTPSVAATKPHVRTFHVRGDVVAFVDHFRHRVLLSALNEAFEDYWLRRAEQFEQAMHRPGDFPGMCSVDQVEARNAELAEKAKACRHRARLAELTTDEIREVG